MARFVGTDAMGLPLKRKQVPHACVSCQKKKRRCTHHDPDASSMADGPPSGAPVGKEPRIVSPSPSSRSQTSLQQSPTSISRSQTKQRDPIVADAIKTPRFVGDLNPQSVFYDVINVEATRDSSNRAGVGIFFTETSGNSSPGVAEPNGGRRHKRSTVTPGAATLSDLIMPHVEAYCLTVLPPEAEYRRLETIFYTKIHPLFPAIPSSLVSPERTDATVVLYKQAICLAAAADPSSAPYLRLCLPGQQEVPKRPLTTQTFHKHLSSAIRLELSLDVVLVPDRVSLIRILSLVSMFIQPATADEADIASELQGRAIQHVETLGLHLRGYRSVQPREGQEREGHKGRDEADDILSLFLAVWALDRINAAVYGRPCLLHERDLRQDLNESIAKQEPCFRVFLNLVQQLDKIIHLYRPAIDVPDARKIDIDVPVLEDLLVEAGATKLPSALIATMEVFYHAIIVLSCRLPPLNPSVPPLQIHTQIPPPAANCRRTLAAERITLVIGTEFPYPGSETPAPSVLKTLPLLPVVPYALSLSLSVAYRKIRYTHTRVGLFFDRAKSTFALNCALLRTMGEAGGVWSARVLAAMADRVLGEMDRKATAVHGGAGDGPGLDVPRAVAQPTSLPASPESTTQTAAAAAESIALTQPSDWQQKHPNHAMGSSAADDTGVVAIAPASQPPAWDWDAFGQLLDPAFLDLDAVDAALEANLDVGATAALPWGWAGWRGFELDVDGGGA